MMPKITETTLDRLVPDDMNMNEGCEYGSRLVEESIRQFGLGRSILVDKNNRIIAGNKTVENAGAIGLEDVIVVETTGNQMVAVKRMDVDLDTAFGREMAIADNATAKANIVWDTPMIMKVQERFDIDPQKWGVVMPEPEPIPEEEPAAGGSSAQLIVRCQDDIKLSALSAELESRGFIVELKE